MLKPFYYYLTIIVFTISSITASVASANNTTERITVYQDPNCGCCDGWAEHMRSNGFEVKQIKTNHINQIKQKFSVPAELSSCHTAIIDHTNQLVEGHVPANVVRRLIISPDIVGVSAPGMPVNSPGMGEMDGNLVTVDFNGEFFSRD